MVLFPGCPCCCSCACGETFPAGELTLADFDNRRELTLTLDDATTRTWCFDVLPIGGGVYVEQLDCIDCFYRAEVFIDPPGTRYVTIFFKVSNPAECDCDTLEGCELEVVAWENGGGVGPLVDDVTLGELCG